MAMTLKWPPPARDASARCHLFGYNYIQNHGICARCFEIRQEFVMVKIAETTRQALLEHAADAFAENISGFRSPAF
jgi:hypothetical protein